MNKLQTIRKQLRAASRQDAESCLNALISKSGVTAAIRQSANARALEIVKLIRSRGKHGLMEIFLAEYGLSSQEGVALMCLSEALLRVPDQETIDALIEDKIAPSSWGNHLGHSSSSLVNASTWALMLTGKVLEEEVEGITPVLRRVVKRLGEPLIRIVVQRIMRELGHQFVLGRTIDEALTRSRKREDKGYTFSYDMLGEAAITAKDAKNYYDAYSAAIDQIASHSQQSKPLESPGISVKLSALHPRYAVSQRQRVITELVETTLVLARQAKQAKIGFTIDAEEAERLDLSLVVIEAVLQDSDLAGWEGFGVVVQAYGKRAPFILDWLYELATKLDRQITVRLVKGAYWDTEIKRSQVEGLSDFPVFTHKSQTDVSYLCCAGKLWGMTDRVYPQFATHNAHTVAFILSIFTNRESFEFQRLQGMGEALYDTVMQQPDVRCRIYAPVGAHRDLLAYLVRRLLENGANSSFVNQIINIDIAAEIVASDPFDTVVANAASESDAILFPPRLYGNDRANSKGWDQFDHGDIQEINDARAPFRSHQWHCQSLLVNPNHCRTTQVITNPGDMTDKPGEVIFASPEDVDQAIAGATIWHASPKDRRLTLIKASNLLEQNFGELFAALTREAGKTPVDGIAELREAVDFLRYYANEGIRLDNLSARGIYACISPWNFPLAIFIGQISAALAAGNAVIAKPAEATSIVAFLAVKLMYKAGVPRSVLQLVLGLGQDIGAQITQNSRINGICFTGSTTTAQSIHRSMATHLGPEAPLIAETGGLNAMIVDSTALPQQAVEDIVVSAFQSAGQRCSALRILYLQEDIANEFLAMLYGAMDELVLGNPWEFSTDIGPVIDANAVTKINSHIMQASKDGHLLKQITAPEAGYFIGPTVIKVKGIESLTSEIFGPVLHVALFKSSQLDNVVDAINGSGYGLTFGMHSRIDSRIEQVTSRMEAGNIYINRNQIGAIVGSQPFGGEGLSGTGPKAGGPNYVAQFTKPNEVSAPANKVDLENATHVKFDTVQSALARLTLKTLTMISTNSLPGPTGESNRLSIYGRGTVLCLGPGTNEAMEQARIAADNGCMSLIIVPGVNQNDGIDGFLPRKFLADLKDFSVVALWSDPVDQKNTRIILASRPGQLLPLSVGGDLKQRCILERHICIDTTAAGGNASLLAAAS